MSAGRVFSGFDEAPPQFWPTYKFDSGTDQYDTSAKQRVPAHCDRVLWRVQSRASNHRMHRPSLQATPPAVADSPNPATDGGHAPATSGGVSPGGSVSTEQLSLRRQPSTHVIKLAGTGTANLINPALSTAVSTGAPASPTATLVAAGAALRGGDRRARGASSLEGPLRPWHAADVASVYYTMHMNLRISDHKPVSALLEVSIGFNLGTVFTARLRGAQPPGAPGKKTF